MLLRRPVRDQWPVTASYGYDPSYPANKGWHFGIDYGCPAGTPVYAVQNGHVRTAAPGQSVGEFLDGIVILDGAWGTYVELYHKRANWLSGYAHLSKLKVQPGQRVRRGQVLGWSGDTGLTYGPHLHFQIIKDGHRPDPTELLPQ